MTATQIAARKNIYRRFRSLSDRDAERVLRFMDTLEDDTEREPNEETIAAFREAENLDNLTTCTDLQDMLRQCGLKR